MTTYVALLRGINVGGNTLIKMAELKACFEKLGYSDVTTYINSGNVIFRTAHADPRMLESVVEAALTKQFGYTVVVVVRSYQQISDLLRNLPASWQDTSDKRCDVIFLRHEIDSPKLLEQLVPKEDIDELHYQPGALLWSAPINKLTRSNLLKLAASPLYKQVTIRIVNTLRKVADIMKRTDELA